MSTSSVNQKTAHQPELRIVKYDDASRHWVVAEPAQDELIALTDADRLAAVREVSTKALHDIILAVLDAHDGCSLDSVSDRERVADSLTRVLAAL